MLPFGYTVFLQSPLSLTVLSDNIYIYFLFVCLFVFVFVFLVVVVLFCLYHL